MKRAHFKNIHVQFLVFCSVGSAYVSLFMSFEDGKVWMS